MTHKFLMGLAGAVKDDSASISLPPPLMEIKFPIVEVIYAIPMLSLHLSQFKSSVLVYQLS